MLRYLLIYYKISFISAFLFLKCIFMWIKYRHLNYWCTQIALLDFSLLLPFAMLSLFFFSLLYVWIAAHCFYYSYIAYCTALSLRSIAFLDNFTFSHYFSTAYFINIALPIFSIAKVLAFSFSIGKAISKKSNINIGSNSEKSNNVYLFK